jgi:cytidylate kinase
MARSVVCISHASGAGGEEVGRLVAEQLGYVYVDDDIVARAAAAGAIDSAEVADEERRKSFAARLLEGIAQGGEAWAVTHGGSSATQEALRSDNVRALIKETIAQTAARGNVVIVAHGASHMVVRRPDTLRVLVTASPTTRASRIGRRDGLDAAHAAREVKQSDAARRDYLRRFYDIDEELPTLYDVVVNTDGLTVEQAARLVAQAGSE